MLAPLAKDASRLSGNILWEPEIFVVNSGLPRVFRYHNARMPRGKTRIELTLSIIMLFETCSNDSRNRTHHSQNHEPVIPPERLDNLETYKAPQENKKPRDDTEGYTESHELLARIAHRAPDISTFEKPSVHEPQEIRYAARGTPCWTSQGPYIHGIPQKVETILSHLQIFECPMQVYIFI